MQVHLDFSIPLVLKGKRSIEEESYYVAKNSLPQLSEKQTREELIEIMGEIESYTQEYEEYSGKNQCLTKAKQTKYSDLDELISNAPKSTSSTLKL